MVSPIVLVPVCARQVTGESSLSSLSLSLKDPESLKWPACVSTRPRAARLNLRYAPAISLGAGYLELVVALIRRPRPLGSRPGLGPSDSRRTRRLIDTNHFSGNHNTKKQRPGPGHRARCSRPFVAGEPGCRRQALVSWVLFEGALAGSVLRWLLRGRKKQPQKIINTPDKKRAAPAQLTPDAQRDEGYNDSG